MNKLGFSKHLKAYKVSMCGQQSAQRREYHHGSRLSPYHLLSIQKSYGKTWLRINQSTPFDRNKLNRIEFTELKYVDNTVLLSTTVTGLQNNITSVKESSESKGFILNAKSTKIMTIDKGTIIPDLNQWGNTREGTIISILRDSSQLMEIPTRKWSLAWLKARLHLDWVKQQQNWIKCLEEL